MYNFFWICLGLIILCLVQFGGKNSNLAPNSTATLVMPNSKAHSGSSYEVRELIVVCCHGIYIGGPSAGHDEKEWLIKPFQSGETPTFIAHIKAGLEAASRNRNAVVIFSGGATKPAQTPLSEGRSYLNLALENDLFGYGVSKYQLLAEEDATDSYQNIILSLLLYNKHVRSTGIANKWPEKFTVVSHEFKRKRFLGLHLDAIRWPSSKTEYIGIDPPEDVTAHDPLVESEMRKAYRVWEKDPYGCNEVVKNKRIERGWNGKDFYKHLYSEGLDDTVQALLDWEGGKTGAERFPGPLPWKG